MPVADISDIVFAHGRKGINELYVWLDQNVGKHYRVSCEDPVVSVGHGWEIRTVRWDTQEGHHSKWVLDIEDEKKFMLYCLTRT